MNWNDYIDKSYERMLAVVTEEGLTCGDYSEEALRNEVTDIAYTAVQEKNEYTAEKDVCGIIFDELAREDLDDSYYLHRFLEAVRDCYPVKADRIAQMAANEINIDAVVQYCLEFDD